MIKPITTPDANADLVSALNALENVAANRSNPAFRGSRYVTLDQLFRSVKPILEEHNLAICQTCDTSDQKIGVVTSFRHKDGTVFPAGNLYFSAPGMTEQRIGLTLTYLRRQSLVTACCISVDTDLDGNAPYQPQARGHEPVLQPVAKAGYEAHPQAAARVLIRKGWLKEGQTLADLSPEHKEAIDNNPAFDAAVQKEAGK